MLIGSRAPPAECGFGVEFVKTRGKRSPRTRGKEKREVMEKRHAIGVWSGEGKEEEAREEGNTKVKQRGKGRG